MGKKRHTKSKKPYTNKDLWNLDMHLSKHIMRALKQFKKVSVGIPGDMKDKAEWDAALDEMIWSFKQASEMYDNCPRMKYIDKKPQDEIDKLQEAYEKRVDHGLALFVRYLGALWI